MRIISGLEQWVSPLGFALEFISHMLQFMAQMQTHGSWWLLNSTRLHSQHQCGNNLQDRNFFFQLLAGDKIHQNKTVDLYFIRETDRIIIEKILLVHPCHGRTGVTSPCPSILYYYYSPISFHFGSRGLKGLAAENSRISCPISQLD